MPGVAPQKFNWGKVSNNVMNFEANNIIAKLNPIKIFPTQVSEQTLFSTGVAKT